MQGRRALLQAPKGPAHRMTNGKISSEVISPCKAEPQIPLFPDTPREVTRTGVSLYPLVKFNLRSIWISKHWRCSRKSKKLVEILSFNPGE